MVSKSEVLGEPSLIFVTVGSTNFPFDRLFVAIDNSLKKPLYRKTKLIAQVGLSNYRWKYKNVTSYKYLKPQEMERLFRKADKIITHGGPGTLYSISKASKLMPLVVARLNKFNEHVNDHQVHFIKSISIQLKARYSSYFMTKEQIQYEIDNYLNNQNISNHFLKSFFLKKTMIVNRLDKYINAI